MLKYRPRKNNSYKNRKREILFLYDTNRERIILKFEKKDYYTLMCIIQYQDVYSIQHYVIKFVSYLQQVGGFHQVLRFLPPIKLTATIQLKYC